jgi:hypothetical protein
MAHMLPKRTLSQRVAEFKEIRLTTKRAGHPEPDAAWYRNTDSTTGEYVPMTFSKENFIRGFNLTVGEYYRLGDMSETNYVDTHSFGEG